MLNIYINNQYILIENKKDFVYILYNVKKIQTYSNMEIASSTVRASNPST